ncbi:Bac-rhamnosid multi-domain protein [Pyrenophora tritici-repentis]|nr:Bac-rhamnosid multi-domain protein [Pyrenophora tritici-repentis]KAI0610593.1 Bac-rhamnosid multi-domain protein [Pyrenophora tritici-repentis]KAI0617231.1 Bac-rhamnosid multi-domain protein [Pyrenophora tritici-repentis]
MRLCNKLFVAGICFASVHAFVDYGILHPKTYTSGSTSGTPYDSTSTIVLTPSNPMIILDYGTEVAGFPFISTSDVAAAVQLEFKYGESLVALSNPIGDGPWTFSNGLSNSFRVETFNVSTVGYTESFFIQGGQRWQSVRLLTNSSVTIESIGMRATGQHTDANELPGHMTTSNDIYNRIFDLGGRVVQVACVDKGNAPSTWEITDKGALIRGQTSAQSAEGVLLKAANYTLSFDTKITRGGTGWRVGSGISPIGPYFLLTSNYPDNNAFQNTNRTLLPPNTLIFNSDWGLVNQSSLPTPGNKYYPLNITVEEEKWHHISTSIQEDGYHVQLNGIEIAVVALPPPSNDFLFRSASRYEGTWGFGAFQDQISVVSNVSVTAANGTQIYSNPMTSQKVLVEYGVAPLNHSVCLDGAKRDRLVWIGDFYHTVRVLAQTTARWDYIIGSIEYALSYQVDTGPFAGFVPISTSLGTRPEYTDANPTWTGLVDYQDLFLAGIGEYFRYTGDTKGLRKHWDSIKKLAEARITFIDPSSGLVAGSPEVPNPASFLGPANGSAVTGLFAFTMDLLVPLALDMGDAEVASKFNSTASGLRDAINDKLWNPSLETYSLSLGSPGNFSLTGIAWAMLSGAANGDQASSSIRKLEELRFGVGYKTISSDEKSSNYQLALNPSGFLLEALFQTSEKHQTNSTAATLHLLDGLWASMVNNDSYSSGASWEYVKPYGSPGIDLFTSLAHPWGAAPSYVLPEYLLGVRPVTPGYKEFVLQPAVGYLGLKKAAGRVPTPFGGINATWSIDGLSALLTVDVPANVTGTLKMPAGWAMKGLNHSTEGTELLPGHHSITLYVQ